MPNIDHKYTMVISRTTIDKLGIRLYDKVSAVLAELIANCYDADAEHVTITAPLGVYLDSPRETFEIVVEDDGHGMTFEEVNNFYLRVGTDRRGDPRRGDESRGKHRKVMGRKGIGKLAPFGICREVEVRTAGGDQTDEGYPVSNLILRLDNIMRDVDEEYHPEPGPLDGKFANKRGTIVILRDFYHRKVPDRDTLHRQLAARFGIARPDWSITVIDSHSGAEPFSIGDLAVEIFEDTKMDVSARPINLPDGGSLPVTGWVAYAKRPYKDEEMAGVRVYARGKIVAQTRDFGLGAGFTGEYKLRSYVVGEIHADWLDEEEDLIRSDRQDILWNSEFGQAFREWGQDLLRELGRKGETSIRSETWNVYKEKSQIERRAAEAFKGAPGVKENVISVAKALVSRANPEAVDDHDYVASLTRLAFAIGPHKTLLDKLREVALNTNSTFAAVVELFESARIAEIYSLGQIADERVKAITRLEQLLRSGNPDEAALQRLIESAPWLIAPDWTPLTANKTLDRFKESFEAWYGRMQLKEVSATTSGIDNPKKRPDFVLISHRGVLQVVEIKRPRHILTDAEFSRLHVYYKAISSFLKENPDFREDFGKVRLTLICDGVDFTDPVYQEAYEGLLREEVLTRRTWTEFLASTQQAHEDFLRVVSGKNGVDADD